MRAGINGGTLNRQRRIYRFLVSNTSIVALEVGDISDGESRCLPNLGTVK